MSLSNEKREEMLATIDEALISSELYFNRQIQSLASTSHDPRAQSQIIRGLSPMITLLQESRALLREIRLDDWERQDR